MTKPDLMAELAEVVRLDGLATPGKVELHTSCSWRRIMADQRKPFLVPGIDPDRHPNMDSIENAQFVVALVNWYRTHHAELEAVARDAARYRWLRDEGWFDASVAKHYSLDVTDTEGLGHAIDICMHNSAREGLDER